MIYRCKNFGKCCKLKWKSRGSTLGFLPCLCLCLCLRRCCYEWRHLFTFLCFTGSCLGHLLSLSLFVDHSVVPSSTSVYSLTSGVQCCTLLRPILYVLRLSLRVLCDSQNMVYCSVETYPSNTVKRRNLKRRIKDLKDVILYTQNIGVSFFLRNFYCVAELCKSSSVLNLTVNKTK